MAKQKTSSLISHGTVTINRRAKFDYEILEELEAGIVLVGAEVKSVRMGRVNLANSYAGIKNGQITLFNMNIEPYPYAPLKYQPHPKRPRALLLKRKEQNRLAGTIERDRLTLIPLRLYFNNRGMAKIALGIGRGKRTVDKRDSIKDREWKIQKQRTFADYNRS